MRAIRAVHYDLPKYKNIFIEVSGMDIKEYRKLCTCNQDYRSAVKAAKGCTNYLTAWREYLVSKGYEEAVKKTDERFLKERLCADCSPEKYDSMWAEHMKLIPESYPSDAL